MVALLRRLRCCGWIGFEWNHLERHAEDFGDFFGHQAAVAQLVRPPPESPANNLLAEQLRHERPKADDVRHSVAIPAFCKHPHRDDAADVTSRRMERPSALRRKLLESLRIDGTPLLITWP